MSAAARYWPATLRNRTALISLGISKPIRFAKSAANGYFDGILLPQ
jgi:hypothetical protein